MHIYTSLLLSRKKMDVWDVMLIIIFFLQTIRYLMNSSHLPIIVFKRELCM